MNLPILESPIYTPLGFPDLNEHYLAETYFFDFSHEALKTFAATLIDSSDSPKDKAIKLFYAVRDQITYDPYTVSMEPSHFKASHVLNAGRGFCIDKAALLCALCRLCEIPCAIGLSDVRNHFTSDKLKDFMGDKDIFINHAYVAMYLNGKWVKAVPAFNIGLCNYLGVNPTEFDGENDALLQELDTQGRLHTVYLRDNGLWSDLPFQRIYDDFKGYYKFAQTSSAQTHDPKFHR